MKEHEQNFSPESIDQLTERFFDKLPAQDSRLMADLYQAYTPYAEEHRRSLQRIWGRFAQVQEHRMPLQASQRGPGSARLSTKGTREVNAHTGGPGAPVPGTFQGPLQPLPRWSRRSPWRRLSGGVTVAVVLLIVLSWVLLTHAFPMENLPTTLAASLALDRSPHLNQNIVLLVKSSAGGQYLAAASFDTYDGRAWSTTAVSSSQLPANKRTVSEGSPVHLVTQQITVVNVVNPAGEQQPYIFGTGQIASVDQPTTLLINKTTGSLVAVLRNNGQRLAAGDQYIVQSYVSSADVQTLRSITLPADTPPLPPNYDGPLPHNYYNPAILRAYLQHPDNLDPNILRLAQSIVADAHATTMYDKALALQNYLRSNYKYNVNVNLPPGQEGVSWFLFHSGNQGFCNYFASAMTMMARLLGMPARVVDGYTNGQYDPKHTEWVIRGVDAHLWTQIYFAGYGWINFEPSPGFSQFTRPLNTGPHVTNSIKTLPS
jgi:transglutaminase-like putative cysteine protease